VWARPSYGLQATALRIAPWPRLMPAVGRAHHLSYDTRREKRWIDILRRARIPSLTLGAAERESSGADTATEGIHL